MTYGNSQMMLKHCELVQPEKLYYWTMTENLRRTEILLLCCEYLRTSLSLHFSSTLSPERVLVLLSELTRKFPTDKPQSLYKRYDRKREIKIP